MSYYRHKFIRAFGIGPFECGFGESCLLPDVPVTLKSTKFVPWVAKTVEEFKTHPAYQHNRRIGVVDHVVPRSLGGTNELENLRPAHFTCNSTLYHETKKQLEMRTT